MDRGSRIRNGKIRIQDKHPGSAQLAGYGTWIRQMSEKKSSSGMVGADTGSSPYQKTTRNINPIQRGQGQILPLFFWNFWKNFKIIDHFSLSHSKVRTDIFRNFFVL
jgi:hypothetical protein